MVLSNSIAIFIMNDDRSQWRHQYRAAADEANAPRAIAGDFAFLLFDVHLRQGD
jgi:hypothetical protein